MESLIRKILVPTDFSESAARAVTYAAALARRLGASLHLVHVIGAEAPATGPIDSRASESQTPGTPHCQEARRSLAAEADRLRAASAVPLSISTEVRGGSPARAVSDAIIDFGADIVVMATHGRTGLSHLLMGSVAEQVIRVSRVPVLIVRECGQAHVHRPAPGDTVQMA